MDIANNAIVLAWLLVVMKLVREGVLGSLFLGNSVLQGRETSLESFLFLRGKFTLHSFL